MGLRCLSLAALFLVTIGVAAAAQCGPEGSFVTFKGHWGNAKKETCMQGSGYYVRGKPCVPGKESQSWLVLNTGNVMRASDGRCLEVIGDADWSGLKIAACKDDANQHFYVTSSGLMQGPNERCVVMGSSGELKMYACGGRPDREVKFTSVHRSDGLNFPACTAREFYFLKVAADGSAITPQICMDGEGYYARFKECNTAQPTQKFAIHPKGMLVIGGRARCLAAMGGPRNWRTVRQESCKATPNQLMGDSIDKILRWSFNGGASAQAPAGTLRMNDDQSRCIVSANGGIAKFLDNCDDSRVMHFEMVVAVDGNHVLPPSDDSQPMPPPYVAPDQQPVSCLDADESTPKGKLVSDLTSDLDTCFANHASRMEEPWFKNVGPPDWMKCNIASSIANVQFAATTAGQAAFAYYGFFNQADRSSCSLATAAAWLSTAKPYAFAEILCDLYWTGSAIVGDEVYDSPMYLKDLVPTDDPNCNDVGTGCQTGATWIWAFTARAGLNNLILEKRKDSPEYALLEKAAIISVSPGGSAGASATGVQAGDGRYYFALPSDISNVYEFIEGTLPTTILGACGDDVGPTCGGLLDDLLPWELAQLVKWFEGAAAAVFGGGERPVYEGYDDMFFPAVKAITENPDLGSILLKLFHPITKEDFKAAIGAGVGVGVAFNDVLLQDANGCTDGIHVGCIPTPDQTEQYNALKSSTCANPGQPPCVPNHFVFAEKCDENEICTIWTWGVKMLISMDDLISTTYSVVY